MNTNEDINDKQRLLGSDDASELTDTVSDGQSEAFVHETTSTTGNSLFGASEESGKSSRRVALVGLGFSATVGILYLIIGIIIAFKDDGVVVVVFSGKGSAWKSELASLALTALNTLVTSSIGFVHAVTQKTILAVEGRGSSSPSPLQFNTNLRLCVVPRSVRIPFWHPNGTSSNVIMAFLLILSYTATSLTLIPSEDGPKTAHRVAYAFSVPLCMLGVCTLCETFIATAGIRYTHGQSLLWSSDPLVTIKALRVTDNKGRCMCNVVDTITEGGSADMLPRKPSKIQPSAWRVRRTVRFIVIGLWGVVAVFAVWGVIIAALQLHGNLGSDSGDWKFLGQKETWYFFGGDIYGIELSDRYPWHLRGPLRWLVFFAVIAVIQSPITLGLHCCDLLVNVVRDENIWRKASTQRGVNLSTSALQTFCSFWPNVLLQIWVPFLHWMYSLAVRVLIVPATYDGTITCGSQEICETGANQLRPALTIFLFIIQTWYFAIAFAVFSAGITMLANWKPRGGQPATYGHIQTLANLVDEWPRETMWWGHKSEVDHGAGQRLGHAGTSDHKLEPIRFDLEYA